MYRLNPILILLSIILFSCSEQDENLNNQTTNQIDIESNQLYANTNLQENLIRYASEILYGMYQVSFSKQNTRLLNKTELLNWITRNERNKSFKVNRTNRALLKRLLEQDVVQAIWVKTDQSVPFKEAVYILIPVKYRMEDYHSLGALVITDAQSNSSETNDDGGGGSDEDDDPDGEDDPDDEEERACTFQQGWYWDATQLTLGEDDSESDPFPECPYCSAEVVDCDNNLAGYDGCDYCSVN